PAVLLKSENQPTPVFAEPVVRLKSAFCPSAVLNPGYAPSGGGITAKAFWAERIAKHASSSISVASSGVVFLNWINGFIILLSLPGWSYFRSGGSGRDEEPSGEKSSA